MQIYCNSNDHAVNWNFNLEIWDKPFTARVVCDKCEKKGPVIEMKVYSILPTITGKLRRMPIGGICDECMALLPEDKILTDADFQAIEDELAEYRAALDPKIHLSRVKFIEKSILDAKQTFANRAVEKLREQLAAGLRGNRHILLDTIELGNLKAKNGKIFKKLHQCMDHLDGIPEQHELKEELIQEFSILAATGHRTEKQWNKTVMESIYPILKRYDAFEEECTEDVDIPGVVPGLGINGDAIVGFGSFCSKTVQIHKASRWKERIEESKECLAAEWPSSG